jgi:hypothetical protein
MCILIFNLHEVTRRNTRKLASQGITRDPTRYYTHAQISTGTLWNGVALAGVVLVNVDSQVEARLARETGKCLLFRWTFPRLLFCVSRMPRE